MTIFPRYVSSRFKDLKVGISSYSEDRTALEVIGNVGVGTTNPDVAVGTGNTAKLAVGIATANNIHAKQYFGDENNNFIASGAGSGQVGIDSGATLNILIGRGNASLDCFAFEPSGCSSSRVSKQSSRLGVWPGYPPPRPRPASARESSLLN